MTSRTLVMIGYFAGYVAGYAYDGHLTVWVAVLAWAVLVWALHQARDIDRR